MKFYHDYDFIYGFDIIYADFNEIEHTSSHIFYE